METEKLVHNDYHRTFNCERCLSEYCSEIVDLYRNGEKYKGDCGYWKVFNNPEVETRGLCEFCKKFCKKD